MDSTEDRFRKNLNSFYNFDEEDLSEEEKFPIYLQLESLEDRYETLECLGKGGMKTVHKVYDNASERELALATPNDQDSRESHEDFLREAQLNSSLLHPNIMPIYDIGLNQHGVPFFVMELKTGDSLKDRLINHPNESIETSLQLFLKICDGLAYTHSKHILHLDLKPENIQVGNYGEVLICDWGCADYDPNKKQHHNDKHGIKSDLINLDLPTNLIMGTPGYVAPELYQSKKKLSPSADIYALGVILYELLYKKVPTSHEALEFHSSQVPNSLKAICQKALSAQPEARYASVSHLKKDLQAYLAGYIPTAHQAHLGLVFFMFIKRHALLSSILILATGILLSISLVYNYQLNQSKNETEIALERVTKEQSISKKLQVDLEETVIKEAFSFIFKGFYSRYRPLEPEIKGLIRKLNLVTKQNPQNYRAWKAMGLLYFLTQNFKEAALCHEHIGDNMELYYRQLCIDLIEIKGDKIVLDIEDLAKVVEENLDYKGQINYAFEKMLIFDHEIREETDRHGFLLRAHLKLINPDWEVTHFNLNEKTEHLVIGGKGLKHLIPPDKRGSRRNVLLNYDISRLTFEDCDLNNSAELKGLNLIRLDIRRTKLLKISKEDLPPVAQLISITVTPKQLEDNPFLTDLQGVRIFSKPID